MCVCVRVLPMQCTYSIGDLMIRGFGYRSAIPTPSLRWWAMGFMGGFSRWITMNFPWNNQNDSSSPNLSNLATRKLRPLGEGKMTCLHDGVRWPWDHPYGGENVDMHTILHWYLWIFEYFTTTLLKKWSLTFPALIPGWFPIFPF